MIEEPMNLQQMMRMQLKFQERLDPNFNKMNLQQRVAFIKEHSIHLNQEINEMLYELPYFKPWKCYDNMSTTECNIAMDKAKEEMVDAWHFFMNMMLALGFSADQLGLMYAEKHAENNKRQDEGYDHTKIFREVKA